MAAVSEEVEQLAVRLRLLGAEVAAAGDRLEHRAATAVWHATAANAFRARAREHRLHADDVAARLAAAARRFEEHAAGATNAWALLARAGRVLQWL